MTKLYKLKVYPDPILHEVSHPVTEFDDNLRDLVDSMFMTMDVAEGIGLAAVQVGALWRVMIVGDGSPDNRTVMINPMITERLGEIIHEEGCLSVPGIYERRERSAQVHVDYHDVDGEHHLRWFSGITAFCIQHELDHLDGKVFIDDYSQLKKKRAHVKIGKTVRKFGRDILKQKVY